MTEATEDAQEEKAKAPQTIQLVAVRQGFRNGSIVHPGTKFSFPLADADGKARKLPKWAQPAEKPLPPAKRDVNVDLKSAATRQAVAKKRGQLAGDLA